MIKKIRFILTISLIMSILLMCGCSDNNAMLPYDIDNSGISSVNTTVSSDKNYKATPISENICTIPEDTINASDKDGISSKGAIVINTDTNTMVYSKNIYERLYPASLTKLATALVCLKYGNLNDTVTISYKAANLNIPGAQLCYIREGDKINLLTLLTEFLVHSGNDAGVAIAEHISGNEASFVTLMNEEMKKIGAADTHFVNPHGLHDDNHYTTVYDMYLILNELMKYEMFTKIGALESYTAVYEDAYGNEVKKIFENTDRFLAGTKDLAKGFKITGSKTGTTYKAGCCLALSTKSKRGSYISIIMNARTYDVLYDEMNTLLKMTKKK